MPDPLLCRIEAVIQRLQGSEPEVCRYLDQASRAFSAGAYDAAIVMAWSATIAHLMLEVSEIGPEVFRYGFRREYPDRKKLPNRPEELVGDDDRAFVQVCNQMHILRVPSDELHRFRDRRNKSAHPNKEPATKDDAEQCLEICLKVVDHPARDVRIHDDSLLVDYALESGSSAETIVRLVHPNYRLSTAAKLMDAYLNNSEQQYDSVVDVWYRLWDWLAEVDKEKLWPKLVDEVVRVLEGRNEFRSEEAVARFIVWPSPDEKHLYRDSIAKLYIHYLRKRVRDGSFSDKDKELALWLYDRLPEVFQRQIVHLCTQWLLDRVKRGGFNGTDLDFNAWLKQRSGPTQQVRFQVIRDTIVRRYYNGSNI